MKRHTSHMLTVVVVLAVIAVGLGAFVYSGLYNIGADDHHLKLTHQALQTLRDRSIHVRSDDIEVPNLDDPQLILKGAGQYAAMCTGCHLAPGMRDSEIRPGLYPQPPNLSKHHVDPQDAFWVIKHGIKMSAMPAWGFSHHDPAIWSMVAFLQKLPGMTPAQYKDIVAKAPPDEDMDGGGDHHHRGDDDADSHNDEHNHADSAAPEQATAAEKTLSLKGLKPKAVPEAEATAEAFHAALQRGDRNAALALLAPIVRISEGGHTQTRDEYAGGHLGQDIAFLKAAEVTQVSMGSRLMGDTAQVGSESTIRTRQNSIRSREMVTLRKHGSGWKIVGVQWQSAPVPEM